MAEMLTRALKKRGSFNASNKPDTCLWCGARLQLWLKLHPEHGKGYAGGGYFCTLRCAFRFANTMAQRGAKFAPVTNEKEEKSHDR